MKAWQLIKPKKFASIDIDAPSAAGQGTIRTLRMGICGTDISCYHGKFPFFDYPRIPGHELGVEVLEVGEELKMLNPVMSARWNPTSTVINVMLVKKVRGIAVKISRSLG